MIGAGFSGAVTAAHLLRLASASGTPLRVVMLNRSGRMARGVAYGTRSPLHVLNVPAGRMSAFADDEDSFLRFAREYDPSVKWGSFVPRRLYGEYLEDVVSSAAHAAAPVGVLEQMVGEAVSVEPLTGDRVRVLLAGGRRIDADRAVLALGNFLPPNPRIDDPSFYADERYIRDPWARGALDDVPFDATTLLIGTGLTMLDVALGLRARGVTGALHAVSRRGLLPQPHRSPGAPPSYEHLPPGITTGPATAKAYLHAVREHVRHLAARGIDWRDVVASLRPVTPALWRRLDDAERARFLRHVRPYWEVHRHRAAPEPSRAIAQLIAAGALSIHRARLRALAPHGANLRATLQRRGCDSVDVLCVDRVINCTGPEGDVRALAEPLFIDLRRRGLICPDPHGLGLHVTGDGALVDTLGRASELLYLAGPLLKARDWEATAVPELRVHCARTAERIIASLAAR